MGAEDLNIEGVCKNKSLNYIGNAGRWHGKYARIWSLWRRACFPAGAFGETIGIEMWAGFQEGTGWGYHIYEV